MNDTWDSADTDAAKAELIAAGWTAKTPTIWKSPSGKLHVGPAGAWKTMKREQNDRRHGMSPARLADAIQAYAEWCGGIHDEGCPEDDTCACSVKWINDGVNETVRFLRAASVPAQAMGKPPSVAAVDPSAAHQESGPRATDSPSGGGGAQPVKDDQSRVAPGATIPSTGSTAERGQGVQSSPAPEPLWLSGGSLLDAHARDMQAAIRFLCARFEREGTPSQKRQALHDLLVRELREAQLNALVKGETQ